MKCLNLNCSLVSFDNCLYLHNPIPHKETFNYPRKILGAPLLINSPSIPETTTILLSQHVLGLPPRQLCIPNRKIPYSFSKTQPDSAIRMCYFHFWVPSAIWIFFWCISLLHKAMHLWGIILLIFSNQCLYYRCFLNEWMTTCQKNIFLSLHFG